MKKCIFLLVCIVSLAGCIKESHTQYGMDKGMVFLIITPNTTKAELEQIASELKEKRNIDLDYTQSTFRENGSISDVKITVDCNDGFKGATQCSSSALKFRNIGFIRDYQTDGDVVFHIGAM